MNQSVAVVLLIVLAVAVAGSALGVLIGTILLLIPSKRQIGGRMALVSGIVLIVSAGLCFGGLPLVSG